MRTLAGRLGVRASSLYRHFPDRSSIEKMLALRFADQLLERMRHSVSGQTGERAVFAAARAYLDLATSEAAFYDMMMHSVMAGPENASTTQISEFFLEIISQATNFKEDRAGATALWSFLHGYTALCRSGQPAEAFTRSGFTRGTQALVRGLSVLDAESARSPN